MIHKEKIYHMHITENLNIIKSRNITFVLLIKLSGTLSHLYGCIWQQFYNITFEAEKKIKAHFLPLQVSPTVPTWGDEGMQCWAPPGTLTLQHNLWPCILCQHQEGHLAGGMRILESQLQLTPVKKGRSTTKPQLTVISRQFGFQNCLQLLHQKWK